MNSLFRGFPVAVMTALGLLTGCGGGGGSSAPASVPPTSIAVVTPTPFVSPSTAPTTVPSGQPTSGPSALPQSCQTTSSALATSGASAGTLTIDSNPRGLPVTINNAPAGTTPVVQRLNPAKTPYLIGIGTSGFTFCYQPNAGIAQSLFYNANAVSNGTLGTIATSGFAATPKSIAAPAVFTMRPPQSNIARPAYSSTELYVRYRSGAREPAALEHALGVARAATVGAGTVRVLGFAPGTDLERAAATLRAHSDVESVDRVRLAYPAAVTPVTPNDPYYVSANNYQWSYQVVGGPSAWAYTTGSSQINVAIIDTGLDFNNPDLAPKVTFAEKLVNGARTSGNAAAQDTDGHGSNVAGIVGAVTNNGVGGAGLGYNVSLQVYKIYPDAASDSLSASSSDISSAIDDAVANGARVINLSLGTPPGSGSDPAESASVANAIARGVVVVAAAGNESATTVDFPGAYTGVISVGASALNDSNSGKLTGASEYVAAYSNSGPGLTLVAPGGDPSGQSDNDFLHWIFGYTTSTPYQQAACAPFVSKSCPLALYAGTSQASPHAAAAAALLLSKNPQLSPQQVRTLLTANADEINDPREGAGRLNIYRAMAALSGDTPPKTPTARNFVAIAYTGSGTNRPVILDQSFPAGVPIASNGAFTLFDIASSASSYRAAVWYDANGNGLVDAGDWFGASGACAGNSACAIGTITARPVPQGFVLP